MTTKKKPVPQAKANILRHPRHPQPRQPRQRKAQPAKHAKKESKTMTTAAADQKEQRGAGTGEHANATRSRNYKEGTEYTEGDASKGRIDYEKLSEGETAEQIPMRDRRAYLIDQAVKNEGANDELNAMQVEQNKKLQLVQNELQDPDKMRESSMETAVASLKMHDPDQMKKDAAARQKQIEAGRKGNAKGGASPQDSFRAGQASG